MANSFQIEISIESSSGTVGQFFQRIGRTFDSNFYEATDNIAQKLRKEAQQNHKYHTRTGNLERSTMVENKTRFGKMDVALFVDKKKAPYAGWIINGKMVRFGKVITTKKGPDNFLDDAVDKNKVWIEDELKKVGVKTGHSVERF